jgi:hypothetical protein
MILSLDLENRWQMLPQIIRTCDFYNWLSVLSKLKVKLSKLSTYKVKTFLTFTLLVEFYKRMIFWLRMASSFLSVRLFLSPFLCPPPSISYVSLSLSLSVCISVSRFLFLPVRLFLCKSIKFLLALYSSN